MDSYSQNKSGGISDIKLQNDEIARLRNQPSPQFTFSNKTAIAAGGYEVIDFSNINDQNAFSVYAPFDTLKAINSSTQSIYLYFGEQGNSYDLLPSNYANTYTKQDLGGGVVKVKIYNAGSGTVAIGSFIVTVWKVGATTNDVIQNVQNKFSRTFGVNSFRFSDLLRK